jgi:hypothetical protein
MDCREMTFVVLEIQKPALRRVFSFVNRKLLLQRLDPIGHIAEVDVR